MQHRACVGPGAESWQDFGWVNFPLEGTGPSESSESRPLNHLSRMEV